MQLVATGARGLAYRTAMRAFARRAPVYGARRVRYRLPAWLTAANVAAGYKSSRPARAQMGSIVRKLSRKKAQGAARRKTIGKKRMRGSVMKPPTTPSARVSSKYAVASSMTKFRKTKVTKQKVPKSAISHYKEFGEFNADKCMYINHQHWGSTDKLWFGIGLGLAKMLLAKARIYPGKSFDDPCIGPRTDPMSGQLANLPAGYVGLGDQNQGVPGTGDDRSYETQLRLIFVTETGGGTLQRTFTTTNVDDITQSPDAYLSIKSIAQSLETHMRSRYNSDEKTWLAEAVIYNSAPVNTNPYSVVNNDSFVPIYVQNLDDAEICLYVNSLIKLQNITLADHGAAATAANPYDRAAIDANPLVGRIYTARGHKPSIDTELASAGDGSLGRFFGDVADFSHAQGFTLLGHDGLFPVAPLSADDIGRIAHIPNAKVLYGNQTVKSGTIHMSAGAMKYHKTSFTLRKTFKALAGWNMGSTTDIQQPYLHGPGSHTLFGITTEHKHGNDTIKIGFNRETDVGCHIKYSRVVNPLKAHYVKDVGLVSLNNNGEGGGELIPTDHAPP